jgi:hypothetical protein
VTLFSRFITLFLLKQGKSISSLLHVLKLLPTLLLLFVALFWLLLNTGSANSSLLLHCSSHSKMGLLLLPLCLLLFFFLPLVLGESLSLLSSMGLDNGLRFPLFCEWHMPAV